MPPTSTNKRIVVCADGTWNDPEDEHPTNVLRFSRAIAPEHAGARQVVFYDWGVGSYYASVRGGAAGVGLEKNVQDGYRFIVQNYAPGDEIFLFGFSRGAYTVRCLAGMLNNCGVLHRTCAEQIPDAFELYKSRDVPPGSPEADRWRAHRAVGGQRAPVAFIGVWDTVGALGIPTRALAFVEERDLFFDPVVGSNVKVARHAVSIDEQRGDFEPTLWEENEGVDVRQVWFAGVHSDVGGGYGPRNGSRLSDVALSWMAREAAAAGLGLEDHLVPGPIDPLSPLHQSRRGFWKVLGKTDRDIPDGAVMHASVKQRHDAGDYDPPKLGDWLQRRSGDWGTLEPG